MSQRPKTNVDVSSSLRTSLNELRDQTVAIEAAAAQDELEVLIKNNNADLTSTEIAAASLGVEPETWKPLSFMNASHYTTLIKSNALSDTLARRLEAYKVVASGDQA